MRKCNSVAVIGGGIAGLAAACVLGRSGRAVRLYEANGKVGGCCTTTQVAGYTFNDGALFLALPTLVDRLFERLGLDRAAVLPLRRIHALQRTVVPGGTVVTFGDDPGISIEGGNAGADEARARRELQAFLAKWDPLLQLFAGEILVQPLSLPRLMVKGWRYLHRLRGTVARQLNEDFTSEAVRAALSGALLYAGVAPDRQPAASLLGLAAMFRQGYFIPEGGMGRIAQTLERAVREQGGEIRLNSRVERIVVKDGRARAIAVRDEGVVGFDAVVSSTSAMHTFATLLAASDVPSRVAHKVRRAVLSHKGYVLQLGLANRIDAGSYANAVLPSLGDQGQIFQQQDERMRWPVYMVPTVAMPELAPPGASIVEAFPPIRQDDAAGDWSEDRKQAVAADTLARLQELHRMEVAVQRVLSPREFQDELHLYAGALYGLSPATSPTQLFAHRTPIRGLYLAGQTTWPGFGVASAGLSGVMSAEALLRDDGG